MACWHGWRRPAPPAERDRKSTRLNSSHGYISYAVSLFRKSTRLNSSHGYISYAVFCLKKKKDLVTYAAVEDASPVGGSGRRRKRGGPARHRRRPRPPRC